MGRTVAIGAQGFEQLIKHNCFYVDKTEFIREWWDNEDIATLITRPRRFGKTLNLDMLNCFFSNKYAGRGDLFEGLDIWKYEKFRELQGTYPVIFLTFADVKQRNLNDAKDRIKAILSGVFDSFRYILKEADYAQNEINLFNEICPGMNDVLAASSLQLLSGMLEQRYGKKVLIFLDEYDTPLQEAYLGGYWDEMVSFIRSMFSATFKSNPAMERSVLTGVTRVSKESIFSDLNNLKVITTTSDRYATCFGFTEEETFAALRELGYSEKDKNNVKNWYDGFTFGRHTDIYNPWSITSFLDSGELKAHWANTSSNSLVANLIRQGSVNVKVVFESLINGGQVVAEIDEEIVFDQLSKKRDAIWSLLLASGYLKVVSYTNPAVEMQGQEGQTNKPVYTMTLTNLEVKSMFQNLILGWFDQDESYNEFVSAMISGNVREMNYYMNKVALATFSSFDSGNHPSEEAEPERFYHGFVLGLMVDKRVDYYIRSNRESGLGRYDVVMEPKVIVASSDKNPKSSGFADARYSQNITPSEVKGNDPQLPGIILEFKVYDEEYDDEKELSDTADNALKQIEDKQYAADLISKGLSEDRIFKYGFAFKGKKVLIKKA